jgi:hypothetical protein
MLTEEVFMTHRPNRTIPVLSCFLMLGIVLLFAAPARSAIRANFESPGNGEVVAGVTLVRGWTFDDAGGQITSVELLIDGVVHPLGHIACCTARPDVAGAPDFVSFPNALNSGFGLTFNWGNLSPGTHTLQVRIQSSGSPEFLSDVRTVTVVNIGGYDFLNQFDMNLSFPFIQEDGTLFADCIQVRDKSSGETKFIDAIFRWQEACQCLVLIDSIDDDQCEE